MYDNWLGVGCLGTNARDLYFEQLWGQLYFGDGWLWHSPCCIYDHSFLQLLYSYKFWTLCTLYCFAPFPPSTFLCWEMLVYPQDIYKHCVGDPYSFSISFKLWTNFSQLPLFLTTNFSSTTFMNVYLHCVSLSLSLSFLLLFFLLEGGYNRTYSPALQQP